MHKQKSVEGSETRFVEKYFVWESARFVPAAWCLQIRWMCLPAEKEWQEVRVSSTAAKEVYLCILSHKFYLHVKLTSGLVMSLLASSRVRRALQGFSIRLCCRIQGILLQIRLKNQKRVSQNLQVR